jgi:hypothetical protein
MAAASMTFDQPDPPALPEADAILTAWALALPLPDEEPVISWLPSKGATAEPDPLAEPAELAKTPEAPETAPVALADPEAALMATLQLMPFRNRWRLPS